MNVKAYHYLSLRIVLWLYVIWTTISTLSDLSLALMDVQFMFFKSELSAPHFFNPPGYENKQGTWTDGSPNTFQFINEQYISNNSEFCTAWDLSNNIWWDAICNETHEVLCKEGECVEDSQDIDDGRFLLWKAWPFHSSERLRGDYWWTTPDYKWLRTLCRNQCNGCCESVWISKYRVGILARQHNSKCSLCGLLRYDSEEPSVVFAK